MSSPFASLHPRRLLILMVAAFIACMAFASGAQAAPGTCVSAPSKDLVCALEVSVDANAMVVNTYGTHLDQVRAIVVDFSDGTTRTYFRDTATNPNPAGVTTQWGVPATITTAQIDAAQLPNGFRKKVDAMLPAAGKRISVTDPSIGGLTVTSYRFYDTLPISSQNKAAFTVQPAAASGWVPPAITNMTTNVDTLTLEGPQSLDTIDYIEMSCAQISNYCPGGAAANVIRFFRPGKGTTPAPNVVVSWTATKIVLKNATNFPGTILSGFTARRLSPLATVTYAIPVASQPYFAPTITSVERTANANQFEIKGHAFGRITDLKVRLEDGSIIPVSGPGSSATQTPGVTATFSEDFVQVTINDNPGVAGDQSVKGHSVENITFLRSGKAMTETTKRVYFLGSLSDLVSVAVNQLTVQGTGLQAAVSLLVTFDDLTTAFFSFVENTGTYQDLTVTDARLGDKTTKSATVTFFDGQTLTITDATSIDSPGPHFTVNHPADGALIGGYQALFNITSGDPITGLLCSLDGAPAVACPGDGLSFIDYRSITTGSHTLAVTAVGPTGSRALAPFSFEVVAAPSVALTGVAAGEVIKDTAGRAITITSNGGPISSQVCSLNGDSINCLNGTIDLAGLARGNYLASVALTGVGSASEVVKTVSFSVGGQPVISNVSVTQMAPMIAQATFNIENADTVTCYVFDANNNLVRQNDCASGSFYSQFYPKVTDKYTFEIVATSGALSDHFSQQLDYSTPVVTFPGRTYGETVPTGDLDIAVNVTGVAATQSVCTVESSGKGERTIPCTSQTIHISDAQNGHAYVVMQVLGFDGNWQYTTLYLTVRAPNAVIEFTSEEQLAVVAPEDYDQTVTYTNTGGPAYLQCRAYSNNTGMNGYEDVPCANGVIDLSSIPTPDNGSMNLVVYVYHSNGSGVDTLFHNFYVGHRAVVDIDEAGVKVEGRKITVPFTEQYGIAGQTFCNLLRADESMLAQQYPCDGLATFDGWAPGDYIVRIYVNNGISQEYADAAVTIEAQLPTVAFTGGVGENQVVRSNSTSVDFGVDGANRGITCQLDDLMETPCTNSFSTAEAKYGQPWAPQTLGNLLGSGEHKITVRAKNTDGTTTAVRNFKIDSQFVITSNASTGPAFNQFVGYYPNGYFLAPAAQTSVNDTKFVREYADGSTLYVALYNEGGYTTYTPNVGASGYYSKTGLAYIKLKADLSPDSSYGVNGVMKVDTGLANGGGFQLFVENGHIYVVSMHYVERDGNISYGFTINRFQENGQLDAAFGSPEVVDLPADQIAQAKMLLPYLDTLYEAADGSIYVAAEITDAAAMYMDSDGALYHFVQGPSGMQLDSSFDGDGLAVIRGPQRPGCTNDPSERERYISTKIAQLADGRVVVGGYQFGGPCNVTASLVALNVDGTPDTSFGNNGAVDLDLGIHAQTFDISEVGGKLRVLSSYEGNGNYVISINLDGTKDMSFNPTGSSSYYKTVFFAGSDRVLSTKQVVHEADGTFTLLGQMSPYGDYARKVAVGRIDANGDPITSFGTNGVAILSPDEPTDTAPAAGALATSRGDQTYLNSVHLDASGRVIMAGIASATSQASIRRMDSAGVEG